MLFSKKFAVGGEREGADGKLNRTSASRYVGEQSVRASVMLSSTLHFSLRCFAADANNPVDVLDGDELYGGADCGDAGTETTRYRG